MRGWCCSSRLGGDCRWPTTAAASGTQADNLAYVIYTSGSTGQPKGAMIRHRGVVNRLAWMDAAYRLQARDRVLQKTPFGFDVSVWELFWPLIRGAGLVMARPGGQRDSAYLVQAIAAHGITIVHFVPSMLREFLQTAVLEPCASLREVICSGEALTADLVASFAARLPGRLHNLYGPTEASVDVSFWRCDPAAPTVAIGGPIWNTQVYVLDGGLLPVPIGVTGELYIGGVGLGRGLSQACGTDGGAVRAEPVWRCGERLYRTGDLARWRADGTLEFLGRLDHQVKLRGYRIELGEIEAVLRSDADVRRTPWWWRGRTTRATSGWWPMWWGKRRRRRMRTWRRCGRILGKTCPTIWCRRRSWRSTRCR